MKQLICNTRLYFAGACIVTNLFLAAFASVTHASDEKSEPSRLDIEIGISRKLVADIIGYAKEGDFELGHILTRFDLSADTDWEAMRTHPDNVERILQDVSKAVLALADHNDNAKSIVAKFRIKAGSP